MFPSFFFFLTCDDDTQYSSNHNDIITDDESSFFYFFSLLLTSFESHLLLLPRVLVFLLLADTSARLVEELPLSGLDVCVALAGVAAHDGEVVAGAEVEQGAGRQRG